MPSVLELIKVVFWRNIWNTAGKFLGCSLHAFKRNLMKYLRNDWWTRGMCTQCFHYWSVWTTKMPWNTCLSEGKQYTIALFTEQAGSKWLWSGNNLEVCLGVSANQLKPLPKIKFNNCIPDLDSIYCASKSVFG